MNEAAIAKLEIILEDAKGRIVQLDRLYNSCTNRLIQDQLSSVIGAFCAAANELQVCLRVARDPQEGKLLHQLLASVALQQSVGRDRPSHGLRVVVDNEPNGAA